MKDEIKELKRELLNYKAKKARNKKQFDYIYETTKAGNKFVKVIYDGYEANGWVEIGRIRLSKNEWVQSTFGIEGIMSDIK